MSEDGGYIYGADFPERGLIARVTRAERIGPPPYGRTSYELDCLDDRVNPEAIVNTLAGREGAKPFAALRIVTTARRIAEELGAEPSEGDWLHVQVRPRRFGRSGPIVFHSQLRENGYTEQSRGVLTGVRLLFSDLEKGPPLRPLGSMVAPATQLAQTLQAACVFPAKALNRGRQIAKVLGRIPRADRILVRDVGQASFSTLADAAGKPLLHFDAGWPISFNGGTAPTVHSITADDAPIVLSHWDWDHLHAFHRFQHLRDALWIVPVQHLGPGAKLVANLLAGKNRLLGWSGGGLGVAVGHFYLCAGTHPMNDTGLALVASLRSGKTALLVGDAAYSSINAKVLGARYDFLVVTHHGANYVGPTPRATTGHGSSVVSVGKGNVYKHPRVPALGLHRRAGWTIRRTSAVLGTSRGDRVLGP